MNNNIIDTKYFRQYREKLGFTNQNGVKAFFGAKDIIPTVDYNYISLLNERLIEIVKKINNLVTKEITFNNLELFCDENIKKKFEKLKKQNIIPRLNNQGRRPEEVYFSWIRGFIISSYFLKALSLIFDVDIKDIDLIGDDDLENIETFRRTPKADLQINLKDGKKLRIEVQSGFQGINDIKQHKVLEAKKIKREEKISSVVIHFDLFNGQVAFVNIDEINDSNINWITRQQMEGQTVFNINQNYFIWKLTENPPKYKDLLFS
jgi:hypothetical protein